MAKPVVSDYKRNESININKTEPEFPWFGHNNALLSLMLDIKDMNEFRYKKWKNKKKWIPKHKKKVGKKTKKKCSPKNIKNKDFKWKDVNTPKFNKNIHKHALLSIDCEMVGTKRGSEVARVSLVDINLNVIYDAYVLPTSKVVDYRTKWSGITKEILDNCRLTFDMCVQNIHNLIDWNTILVGHHLCNDTKCLRLVHYNVIDTQILYKVYNKEKKNYVRKSLKNLAKMYLNEDIQNSNHGHSSVEDAKTTMKLMLLKLQDTIKKGKYPWQPIPLTTNAAFW